MGKIITVQGYENRCLDILLSEYKEEEIIAEDEYIPVITYIKPETQKISKYYPDIYLPNHNTIVEVKSDYTLNKEYKRNIEKFKATVKTGYNLLLYVFNEQKLLYKKLYSINGTVSMYHFPRTKLIFPNV